MEIPIIVTVLLQQNESVTLQYASNIDGVAASIQSDVLSSEKGDKITASTCLAVDGTFGNATLD